MRLSAQNARRTSFCCFETKRQILKARFQNPKLSQVFGSHQSSSFSSITSSQNFRERTIVSHNIYLHSSNTSLHSFFVTMTETQTQPQPQQRSHPSSCISRKSSSAATNDFLMQRISKELEEIRDVPAHKVVEFFPAACRSMVYSLPGNSFCADCGSPGPNWASVSYGILLCLQCSGRHRSFGVKTSFVRSIDMDAWSHHQVLAMLEGGNEQLGKFFDRHQMGNKSSASSSSNKQRRGDTMIDRRYETKAALFYRSNLKKHAEQVARSGAYKGREASRRKYQSKEAIQASNKSSTNSKGEVGGNQ